GAEEARSGTADEVAQARHVLEQRGGGALEVLDVPTGAEAVEVVQQAGAQPGRGAGAGTVQGRGRDRAQPHPDQCGRGEADRGGEGGRRAGAGAAGRIEAAAQGQGCQGQRDRAEDQGDPARGQRGSLGAQVRGEGGGEGLGGGGGGAAGAGGRGGGGVGRAGRGGGGVVVVGCGRPGLRGAVRGTMRHPLRGGAAVLRGPAVPRVRSCGVAAGVG